MVLSIYGEDTYRARQKINEMLIRFRERYDTSGMNMDRFAVGVQPEGEIMSAVGAPPFLAERRMIVVEGLAKQITKKADADLWTSRLAGRGEETIIVLFDGEMTVERAEKNKLYAALGAAGDLHAYPFGVMTPSQATQFVQARIASSSPWTVDAVRELVARAGEDTWRLVNAIDKITAAAGTSPVTVPLIASYEEPALRDKLFPFLDAVREGKSRVAIELLAAEIARGTAPGQLLMMLEREIQLLVELRAYAAVHGRGSERDAARVLGLHPFVVKKTLGRAIQIEPEVMRGMVDAVMRAEERLKVESMPDRDVLHQLVLDLVVPYA